MCKSSKYRTSLVPKPDTSHASLIRVMHVKGLGLPMEVAEVLDACIEPPEHRRVVAAIQSLHMVGALDVAQNLTSLGRVLLQLPVEAAIGKLCLLGCVFRCLGKSHRYRFCKETELTRLSGITDQALTLAAIMTNRDPFVAPLERRVCATIMRVRILHGLTKMSM